jgi:dihydrodipicolinate synthase/N-acetylneuraminate lyase
MSKWQGVFTYPVTTMTAGGRSLDLAAYRDLIDFIVSGGMHGITAMGSIGEFAYLEPGERTQVVQAAVAAANGRVPVISGGLRDHHGCRRALRARGRRCRRRRHPGRSPVLLQAV